MEKNYDIGSLKKHYDKLKPEEKAIRLAAFYSILQGSKAGIGYLARKTSLDVDGVGRYIQGLSKAGAIVLDENGDVVGSHGLSLEPTPHRLNFNGRNLYTWCAADAIGIPAAMELDAKIVSSCAFCKDPVNIEFTKGIITYCNKPQLRLWVVEADLGRSITGCT